MENYAEMTVQQLNDALAAAEAARTATAARLQEIENMIRPTEPVQGAYKVGKVGKMLINAALVSLVLLVFAGKGYTGIVLAVFVALGVSGVIVGKVEAKKGMARYEADMKTFAAEKAAFEAAQTEIDPLKYELAVQQKKLRELKDALAKAGV